VPEAGKEGPNHHRSAGHSMAENKMRQLIDAFFTTKLEAGTDFGLIFAAGII
jgi:hypothetical protein